MFQSRLQSAFASVSTYITVLLAALLSTLSTSMAAQPNNPSDAVDCRIRENALRQLRNADLDDPDWQPTPMSDLASGINEMNSDQFDDPDAGILDLPPIHNPPSDVFGGRSGNW